MEDVAKHASVSKSTVSQYLNKRYEYMGVQTKERIETAIRELGYRPNVLARSLKQKKTATVAIIVANILHRFSTQISRAVEDVCHSQDHHVILCNADDDPQKERKYVEMLRAKQVDGLIVVPTGGNAELFRELEQEQYPLVFVDRTMEGIQAETVLLDNVESSRRLTSHLVERGHERIAMITGPLTISSRRERLAGYRQGLVQHGIPERPEWVAAVDVTAVRTSLAAMLSLPQPPTALIAGNDRVLMEVLAYLREEGIAIPEALAVTVFDDVSFAHIYSPPLTVIAQPALEMGKRAAELLMQRIEGEKAVPQEHRFQGELIIRESCLYQPKL